VLTAKHGFVSRVLRDAKFDVAVFRDKSVTTYLIAAAGHKEVAFTWLKRLIVPAKNEGMVYPLVTPRLLDGHGSGHLGFDGLQDSHLTTCPNFRVHLMMSVKSR
jgi:hypothetical protein